MRRRLRATLLVLASAAWTPWVITWLVDLDRLDWRIPAAQAFLPYVAAGTAAALLLAATVRNRQATALAALGLLVLLAPRTSRVTANHQPAADGPVVTIATANVFVGEGSTSDLADLLRRHHVDVLAIQENTPEFDARAQGAGIREQLPSWLSDPDPRPGTAGLALLSRWPIDPVPPATGDHRSIGGLIHIPGASRTLHLRSVHPPPPFRSTTVPCWQRCTRTLARTRQTTTDVILAGDYNATLDHHPLRDLLASGFRDAAEQTGHAWRPTWSRNALLRLSLDHILVTDRIAVEQVTTHDLHRSDHDVVITRLRLPR
ncbi:MAG: endonuclease/exonuclease/phosphatase family protein [Patulibacter minatonensis]